GFLAERTAFAEAVERAGLTFVGPPSAAIRAMGDKTEARRRMKEAGVPIVPGASAPIDDIGPALGLAREVGYPVMVKATAGGRGPGGGVPWRRHLRVPAGRGPVLLFPRDEHPDPGRAPGDGAGLRRGPGSGATADRGRRADAHSSGLARPAGVGARVPHHQRG